jgi:hypothetical protein
VFFSEPLLFCAPVRPRRVVLRRLLVRFAVAFALVFSVQRSARAAAMVTNGTFDQGVEGWEIRGAVAGSTGIAVMTDNNVTRSLFFQPVPATTEKFAIAFDFRNALSSTVPIGRLADTFFATLYFTNNLQTFDIDTGNYDRAVPLFDMDANGAFDVQGTIGPSSKGVDWSRFTAVFDNLHSHVVPAFELRDLNLINDDSAVALDNVVLFVVPEPACPTLAAFGSGMLLGLRRRAVVCTIERTVMRS